MVALGKTAAVSGAVVGDDDQTALLVCMLVVADRCCS
jgi:hypothetical protein